MNFKLSKTKYKNIYKVTDDDKEYYVKRLQEPKKYIGCSLCCFKHKESIYCSKANCGVLSEQYYYGKIEDYELLFMGDEDENDKNI